MEGNSTAMAKERLEARAIRRILDRNSREVVGWLYEWNTGERVQMWKNGQRGDVVYEEAVPPIKISGVDGDLTLRRLI